jgi:taurine dioxygenase
MNSQSAARPTAEVEVRRLQPNIGAEVSGFDLRHPLTKAEIGVLRQALLDHGVIFLRDQDITRDQHMTFARIFSAGQENPFTIQKGQRNPIPGYPEILSVSADGKVKSAADVWHTDESFREIPPSVSVLRAYVIPSLGGDTVFSSSAAAYAGLTDEVKARIENLTALHAPIYALAHYSSGLGDPAKTRELVEGVPPVEHAVVRIHPETGKRTLYVNDSYTGPIVGLDEREGEALKQHLTDQFKKPDYQVRFQWRPNSIAVWDNRAVQHYAVADYNEPRHLERVTIAGDRRTVGPNGRESRVRELTAA